MMEGGIDGWREGIMKEGWNDGGRSDGGRDTKFESHYKLNNFNFLFLLNLTVKFNITKVNYYFDIYIL